MALVGVSNLHYALLIKDDSTGVTYGAPIAIAGSINIDIKPASAISTLYADNGPAEVASTLGEISVSVENKGLSIETLAALLGHTVAKGVMTSKASDTAPYVAILFEGLKSNGKKKYVKLLKMKFSEPDDQYATLKDSVTFQTDKITGKGTRRDYDDEWKRTADEDGTDYEAATGTAWYTSVEPTV